jgi:hypothetical protein
MRHATMLQGGGGQKPSGEPPEPGPPEEDPPPNPPAPHPPEPIPAHRPGCRRDRSLRWGAGATP